jgi:hypothetical protein
MDIKDLVGLSKPLTRLIEVISTGIGAVSSPYLIRRTAEAKAHEMRVIATALKDIANQHSLPVVFNNGAIEIWQRTEDRTLVLEHVEYNQRAESRLGYQERKRQGNIESITSVAAAELAEEVDVPSDPPDEDWVARFFSSAQDVSSEQMHELWGRILAGEIKRPGSYSLKTLDFVRNMTKADAQILENVARFAVAWRGSSVVVTSDKAWLKDQRQIFPGHHFALGELGIMYPADLTYRLFGDLDVQQELLTSGDFLLIVDRETLTGETHIPVWKFTAIGVELLQLIPVLGDEEYIEQIGRLLLNRGCIAKLTKIIEFLPDGRINYRIIREIIKEAPQTDGDID